MYNPLENFKNPWDLDGEFAQQFLKIDNVLNLSPSKVSDNLEGGTDSVSDYQPDPFASWGRFYEDETDAYKFMVEKSQNRDIEISAYVMKEGVFVLPYIGNQKSLSYTFRDNIQMKKPYMDNFRIRIVSFEPEILMYQDKYKGKALKIYAYVHTHPRNGFMSDVDMKEAQSLHVPIYAIGTHYGESNKPHVYWYNPLDYESGTISGGTQSFLENNYSILLHAKEISNRR